MRFRGTLWRPVAGALLVLAIGSAVVTLVDATGAATGPLLRLTLLARALAAPLFLAAGVLRLACWRISDDPRCALRGVAMLLLGGVSLPSVAFVRSVPAGSADPALVPFTRAVTVSVVLYVVAIALSDEPAERSAVERRVVGVALATSAGMVALVAVHVRMPSDPGVQGAAADGVLIALAVAWLALAASAATKARRAGWSRGTAPLLGLMGVAELLRVPDRPAASLLAAGLTATIGGVVVTSALRDLVYAAQQEHWDARSLSQELDVARARLSTGELHREELSHDARGTLAGIRAAIVTLEHYGDRIEPEAADRLRVATLGELTHLEHLLLDGPAEAPVEFEVAQVLGDVVETRRAAGLDVSLAADPLVVCGVPGDVATVVQNLLVNAQQHAPGARVEVVVSAQDGRAEITVADDGPGMSTTDASRAFDRGHRGGRSGGSGLGLHTARTLARRHGGDVTLRSRVGGATFAVTLPTATFAAAGVQAGAAS